jgi:hypothetical protein
LGADIQAHAQELQDAQARERAARSKDHPAKVEKEVSVTKFAELKQKEETLRREHNTLQQQYALLYSILVR